MKKMHAVVDKDTVNKNKKQVNESTQNIKNEKNTSVPLKSISESIKKHKNILKDNPVVRFIGEKISTSRNYLRKSHLKQSRYEDSERYCRSEKHPLVKELKKEKKESHILYEKAKLKNGEHAHAASYGNLMQMFGDTFKPNKKKMLTSKGDGTVYDALLNYKNSLCRYAAKKIPPNKTKYIKVGFYNDYPCLMVNFKPNSPVYSNKNKKPSVKAFEAWVDYIISYFVGLVNYNACVEKLPIELERRSSFGFLVPTVSPTGNSMRINLGVVPKCYVDLIVDCLIVLDEVLDEIKNEKEVPKDIFYFSEEYANYLEESRYKTVELDNLPELLLTQVEKQGKTTVQNITRTAFARDGVAVETFNTLLHSQDEDNFALKAFYMSLEWAIQRMAVDKNKLTFNREKNEEVTYEYNFSKMSNTKKIDDKSFWKMISEILDHIERIKPQETKEITDIVNRIRESYKSGNMTNLYEELEALNEFIFIEAIHTAPDDEYGDGYGSDSEEEIKIEKETLHSKKLITHSGMRAIWSAIIASADHLKKLSVYMEDAYYETPTGIKLIEKLHKLPQITIVRNPSEANVIIYDLNICVTSGKKSKEYNLPKNKILILDSTSASQKLVSKHIEKFVESRPSALFVVDSGLKNQQIGHDKNQYGTVRIFSKNKNMVEKLYSDIKKFEPPLLSGTSHKYRRMMKEIGTVPVTKMFFPETEERNTNDEEVFPKRKIDINKSMENPNDINAYDTPRSSRKN